MHLMDVISTDLYGLLDNDIFIKIPDGLKMPEIYKDSQESCSMKFLNFCTE